MKIKQAISMILVLCILLAFAGCGKTAEKDTSSETGNTSSDLFLDSEVSSAEPDTSEASSVVSSAQEKTQEKTASSKPTQKGSTALTQTQADAMKGQIDLKGKTLTLLAPAKDEALAKRYAEFCNGKINYITAAYGEMKNVLATKVMSNQAPDIYYVTNQDYPTVLYRNLLQPIDGMIDLSSDLWKDVKPVLDQFTWTDGKHYFVGEYELGNSFWFNKKYFADAGVTETPTTLMAKNNWTWDSFYSLITDNKLSDTNNGKYAFGTAGNYCYALLASAGEDIVYMDKTKGLINNVNSADVAKAMDFMQKSYDSRYTYGGDAYSLFSTGKIAMYYGYSGVGGDSNFSKQLKAGNYEFALFPRMDKNTDYRVSGTTTGYGIPVGAKNVDAALAFLIMMRVDTAYQGQLKQEYITKNHLENSNFSAIYDQVFQQKFVPIVSLGVDKINQVYWPAESKVRSGTPWSTLKAQLSPGIDKAIAGMKNQ